MTDEQTQRTEEALHVAELVRLALWNIHRATGADLQTVLAGAHAEVATGMALAFGREVAIRQCETAAERLRTLPTKRDVALAAAAPAGRA